MNPSKEMYPDRWQGVLPEGLDNKSYGRTPVSVVLFYNLEYFQHRYFPRWIPTNEVKVLNIACGTGEGLIQSAARYATVNFIASDPSEKALDVTRTYLEMLEASNVQIKTAGDLAETSDIIWSTRPLHHFDDPVAFLKQVRSLLKPEGVFVFTADCDPQSEYMLSMQDLMSELLEEGIGIDQLAQRLAALSHKIMEHSKGLEYGGGETVNIPELHALAGAAGLKVLDCLHPHNYDPASYFDDENEKAALQIEDSFLRQALAELVNGQMIQHNVVMARDDRHVVMPALTDGDAKNLIPWRSPYLAYREDEDRIILSLDQEYLLLDERLSISDLSLPRRLFEIIGHFDTVTSLQVIHRRFLPLSWDVFMHFIESMYECDMLFLHRK